MGAQPEKFRLLIPDADIQVQEAAASADCFFPTLPPMSEELLRYGPTPDLVLGIEVVLRRSDQARRRPERP
jgi:hypothetical protein